MQNDVIWAPWRLAYITAAKEEQQPVEILPGGDPECFLCRCAMPGDDRGRWVVARGERTVTVMNRFPYNNGHLLISPLRHVSRLSDLSADEDTEVSVTLKRMIALLEQILKPEGFNVGLNLGRAAGAGVPGHLHWHIVPRWVGDTNCMSTVGGARVIPQSLEALWEALTTELARG